MNAVSGVIGSVAAVGDAIASLLQWWETRQVRLRREQKEETDQRLRMVTDLLDRWILEHARGDHLDFKLAHYLARECLGLLHHVGDKRCDRADVAAPRTRAFAGDRRWRARYDLLMPKWQPVGQMIGARDGDKRKWVGCSRVQIHVSDFDQLRAVTSAAQPRAASQ